MTRKKVELPPERKLLYVRSSQRDLNSFPESVHTEMATALEVARLGGTHPSAKPWKGLGSSVYEIVQDDGDAYRAVYTVKFKQAVYVLHAFQKKSTQGIQTPAKEIETIKKRLKDAEADYRERYGASKKKQR